MQINISRSIFLVSNNDLTSDVLCEQLNILVAQAESSWRWMKRFHPLGFIIVLRKYQGNLPDRCLYFLCSRGNFDLMVLSRSGINENIIMILWGAWIYETKHVYNWIEVVVKINITAAKNSGFLIIASAEHMGKWMQGSATKSQTNCSG